MKQKLVNGRWMIWTTDEVADWDGGTGDPVAKRGWEYERFQSFRETLSWDEVFFDVGTEHGWIAGVLAQEFVNPARMHLFEPSPEFWPNIRKVWVHNALATPAGMVQAFVSDHSDILVPLALDTMFQVWPETADVNAPETPGMAYRDLRYPGHIHSITIDDYCAITGARPTVINVDVEGAELMVMRGAAQTIAKGLVPNIWISVHPDLMEKNFGHTPDQLMSFMASCGYSGKLLGVDHEEHWTFTADPF